MRLLALLGLVALSIAACAPSEEEVVREFNAYVAERNSCTVVEDCVLVYADCPLGCSVAVNRAYKAQVEQKARDLVEDYESGGQECYYDCSPAEPICSNGRCEARNQ